MFEKIFKGLERAHGCTKVSAPAENGVKLKGQSFVVRQPVTTELWDHAFKWYSESWYYTY
jgi:hypothetical protein